MSSTDLLVLLGQPQIKVKSQLLSNSDSEAFVVYEAVVVAFDHPFATY